MTGQTCTPIHSRNVNIVYVVLAITSDILLLCIPLHFLGSLKLTSPEKRGVGFVFFFGTLSISAAVARFTILSTRHTYDVNGGGAIASFDKYYWATGLAFLEITMAEIAFVLPAMRKVVFARGERRQRMRIESARRDEIAGWREATRSRTVASAHADHDDGDRLVHGGNTGAHVGVRGGLGTFYWT